MTSPIPTPELFAIDLKEMQWCANCGGPQVFIPCVNVEDGRVGVCWGCDKEVFVPFTRTMEAA
jgi:hypothetical protein